MAVYAYKSSSPGGKTVTGTLTADTPVEARSLLRQRGVRILECKEARVGSCLPRVRLGSSKHQQEQAAEVARHLSLLLRSGVPLVEALDVLIQQYGGRLQTLLREVREQVAAGSRLADALSKHPAWFDAVFLSAAQIGEASGALEDALAELSEFLNERQSLRSKLTAALLYPALLLILGIGVVLFLMSFVMPQLLGVLTASGKPLPASTLFLKHFSDLLVGHWLALAAVSGTVITAVTTALRTDRGRSLWQRLQLRLPVLGPLTKKTVVAQFAQMTAMLLRSGVPFVEVVSVVCRTGKNAVLAGELGKLKSSVEAGSDIAPALAGSRIFPPLVVQLIDVGQRTGELTAMLTQLKTSYETEVRLAITKFTSVLEPLLIIVLAGVIGFIVFATMMPILEATRVMQ